MLVLHLSELSDRLPMAEHNSGQTRAGCVKRRQSWALKKKLLINPEV
jgi:hypothetical protein